MDDVNESWENLFDGAETAEQEDVETAEEEVETTEEEAENTGENAESGEEAEDETEGQPEEQPEEQAAEDTAGAGEHDEQEDGLDVAYDGQTIHMSREEAVKLAGIGLRSAGLLQELETARNHPSIRLVEELAEVSGMTVDAYVQQARDGMKKSYVDRMVGMGMDAEAAEKMYEDRVELANLRREKQSRDTAAQQAAEKQNGLRRQAEEFVAAYPEVKEFPPAAAEYIAKHPGATMKEAYQATEISRLQAELAKAKAGKQAAVKAAQNKATAPGSAAGTVSRNEDDFAAILLGD